MDDNLEEEKLVNETSIDESEKVAQYNFRSNLYDKINISVKTMDVIIGFLIAVIFLLVLFGVFQVL